MRRAWLIQLPVPQLNFGRRTGNIPFAAACLLQAAAPLSDVRIDIVPQEAASYMGDAALLDLICAERPDVIGFTTTMWNIMRVRYLAGRLKKDYQPGIIVGGPEVTPDNPLVQDPSIDFRVYGEGEALFSRLLQEPELWRHGSGRSAADRLFSSAGSPYLAAPLTPQTEHIMLLETMRGCPYTCAYCFYNKSRRSMAFKEDRLVLEAVTWALEQDVREIYFLDPSLNVRPGLKSLLRQIAAINKSHRLSLTSEIRADHIDAETADLLAAAGFSAFEIGLQSTNPKALQHVRRPTDLNRFVRGVTALKEKGIKTAVDLIVGLPGDDLAGFDRTLQFAADHRMYDNIQVFPLSVLPGTQLRQRRHQLGLAHEVLPPYTVLSTPTFPPGDIRQAFDLAENRFDVALYPLPDLDLAWQTDRAPQIDTAPDIGVTLAQRNLLCKVILRKGRTPAELAEAARRVTHPYQLLIPPGVSDPEMMQAFSIFSQSNPHIPLELAFFAPVKMPDIPLLLRTIRLARPHYLDGQWRLMHTQPGNRAVLFSVLSMEMKERFEGPMQRHIRWWRHRHLPDREALGRMELEGFDGILIDAPVAIQPLLDWQDRMVPAADDLFLIGFARTALNKRWLQKTAPEDYCIPILP